VTRPDRRRSAEEPADLRSLMGRVPPHNAEAETAILGAVLTGGVGALDKVRGIVAADHFYSDANRRVFEASVAIADAGHPVDFQTVAAWLKDRDWVQNVGGISYLSRLLDAPAFAYPERYAAIVREKARVRALIETCTLAIGEAHGDYGEGQAFMESIEQRVFALTHDGADGRRARPMRDVIRATYTAMTSAAERPRPRGISTGLRSVDRMLGGLRPGQQIIVAARPSMGKTAFGLNVAANAAGQTLDDGDPARPGPYVIGAVVFSLEMPEEEVGPRFLCAEAQVDGRQVVAGKASQEDLGRLVRGAHALDGLPIWLLDREDMSVAEMRAELRRIKASWEAAPVWDDAGNLLSPGRRIGLVVVDYLQLVRPAESRDRSRTREAEVSEISRDLKKMARAFRMTCVTLSQLNRAVESRQDKRPNIGDLRESGAIEQDADVILMLFRAYFYLQDKTSEEAGRLRRLAEVIVGKQRNGPTGTALVHYYEEHVRFSDAA